MSKGKYTREKYTRIMQMPFVRQNFETRSFERENKLPLAIHVCGCAVL